MIVTSLLVLLIPYLACPTKATINPKSIERNVMPLNYTHNGTELQGYYAKPDGDGPFPAVIIIPDWDGVNHYEKTRATMVAGEMGYIAFAADIFGKDLHNVTDMDKRKELYSKYTSDPSLFIGRINAAVEQIQSDTDVSTIALIGYCFGGTGSLMYALSEYGDDVSGIVSIHGGLMPFDVDNGADSTPRVLVLSGGDDDTYTKVSALEDTLNDAVGVDAFEITRYSNIQHAFTVFDDDRYNAWADKRSWESTTTFLSEIFGEVVKEKNEPRVPAVDPIDYEDTVGNETAFLRGYLAMPDDSWVRPLPLVVIMPDWDGVNSYEQKRATMLAELGYIAFAADIYGVDLQENLTMTTKIEVMTQYLEDMPLWIQRMQRGIDVAKEQEGVSVDDVAIIGYCFGGSGVVQYGLSGSDGVNVAVSFHGSFFKESAPQVKEDIHPYVLILSGGDDPAHGNQTLLEQTLNKGNATWEISSYANADHGFTQWDNSDVYDVIADTRSWESMKNVFEKKLVLPLQSKNIHDTETSSSPGKGSYSLGFIGSIVIFFVSSIW